MKESVDRNNAGDFDALVKHIQTVGDALQLDARLVINRNVTTRAWLTGLYIVEYEQNGNDRAKYGTQLLQNLSKRLGGKSYSVSNLRNFRQFYVYYPELAPVIGSYLQERFQIHHSPSGELKLPGIQHSLSGESKDTQLGQSLIGELALTLIGQTVTDELAEEGKQQSLTAELPTALGALAVDISRSIPTHSYAQATRKPHLAVWLPGAGAPPDGRTDSTSSFEPDRLG